jgi:hypothetical protein
MKRGWPTYKGRKFEMDEKLKWKSKIKWMKIWSGWIIKMDKHNLFATSQLGVMCQCKLNFFTTKRFVSTETLNIHL